MDSELVGVVGVGLLGRGIAACLLAHGFRVVVYDTGGAAVYKQAESYVEEGIPELIAKAGFPESLASNWRERLTQAASFESFAGCGFAIESVFEDLGVKQQVYEGLEAVLTPDAPIASNSSAIPITVLQSGRRNPARFVGMHWAAPAYVTRFLEVIRGAFTSDQAVEAATRLGSRCGKEPCVVRKDVPGFIVNRLAYAMYREAAHLVETGVADVETVDRAFRDGCGLWASLCGPFRWMDITGGPALYATAMRGVLPTLSNTGNLPEILQDMLRQRAKGIVDGRGFYRYGAADAARWQAILQKQAWAIRKLQEEMDAFLQAPGEGG